MTDIDRSADIPRTPNDDIKEFFQGDKNLEETDWYPRTHGPPDTQIPERQKRFTLENTELGISFRPQFWDAYSVNVAAAAANPIIAFNFRPGRDTIIIQNTGANPCIISPTQEKAQNGFGWPLAAGATSPSLQIQAAGYVYSALGTTLSILETFYESPTSPLPRRRED